MNAYDAFAWFYDRYWAEPFLTWQLPILERLLLKRLPPGAHILDLCCGTGHLARELVHRGFSVTGVDSSFGMLEIARENAPEAAFLLDDAAHFTLPTPADAALCTFDSVNHILDPSQILGSFRKIAFSLKPGGLFLFDCNTPDAYGPNWNDSATVVEADHAFFLRGRFDPSCQRGHTEITMFQLRGHWSRTDVHLEQRPWTVAELSPLLEQAGFTEVETSVPDHSGSFSQGRLYFAASRSALA